MLAVILLYGLLDPEQYFFPRCPLLTLTGLKCPGCGSQRAIHQLLHGNIAASFFLNPLFIPGLLYAMLGYATAFLFPERWPSIRQRWYGKNAAYVSLIVILMFWVGRNLM
jgi:Protein of unknown function (DUF2752)